MRGDSLNGKKNDNNLYRLDANFITWAKEIIKDRIKGGLEDPLNPNGMRRLTKALMNWLNLNPEVKKMLERDMVNMKWEDDRWKE